MTFVQTIMVVVLFALASFVIFAAGIYVGLSINVHRIVHSIDQQEG